MIRQVQSVVLALLSLAVGACHGPLGSVLPLPGIVCWRETEGDHYYFRAEGIVAHILSEDNQGSTPEAIESRRIFRIPRVTPRQAHVIKSNHQCARAAALLAKALRLEDLEFPPTTRVAAAYIGGIVAIEIDEPGVSTVHLIKAGKRVGGWSGP